MEQENKKEKINKFLQQLSQENNPNKYPFYVTCSKCMSNNVTIYHGCDYYNYSSYTQGFTESCGLKCKDCGNACEIENITN